MSEEDQKCKYEATLRNRPWDTTRRYLVTGPEGNTDQFRRAVVLYADNLEEREQTNYYTCAEADAERFLEAAVAADMTVQAVIVTKRGISPNIPGEDAVRCIAYDECYPILRLGTHKLKWVSMGWTAMARLRAGKEQAS